jgi:hypothetical protein
MTDYRIPVQQRGWRHNICLSCWESRCEQLGEPGREPVRLLKKDEWVHCCFCSRNNNDGIYVRENPKNEKLFCVEKHP